MIRFKKTVILDDPAGGPGSATVSRRKELAVGSDDKSRLCIEKTDIEKRCLQVQSLVLFAPSQPSVLRVKDDRIVTHGPAVLLVREIDSSERGEGG